MSGMDGVIQSTLQVAQALSQTAADLPDSLPGVYFATTAAFEAADIGADASYVVLAGDVTAGDGGWGIYVHSPSAGPGTGLVQSADGQWWVTVTATSSTSVGDCSLDIGGATVTSVTDSNVTFTSKVVLQATSSDAAAIHPWIASVGAGGFQIAHDANFGSCSFDYIVAGS